MLTSLDGELLGGFDVLDDRGLFEGDIVGPLEEGVVYRRNQRLLYVLDLIHWNRNKI